MTQICKTFNNKRSNIFSSKAWIIAHLRDANNLIMGHINNYQDDPITQLGISGKPMDSPSIILVSLNFSARRMEQG